MDKRRGKIAGILGGATVLSVAVLFGAQHYRAIIHAGSTPAVMPDAAQADKGINFPTVEEMCKAAGVGAADMPGCISDENSAAEFVGAWFGLNGFLVNGRIDLEQIQLSAQVNGSDANFDLQGNVDPLATPDLPPEGLSFDPTDPLSDSGSGDSPNSPAQIAQYCISSSSDDWLKMHDCIARNDPASRLDGN